MLSLFFPSFFSDLTPFFLVTSCFKQLLKAQLGLITAVHDRLAVGPAKISPTKQSILMKSPISYSIKYLTYHLWASNWFGQAQGQVLWNFFLVSSRARNRGSCRLVAPSQLGLQQGQGSGELCPSHMSVLFTSSPTSIYSEANGDSGSTGAAAKLWEVLLGSILKKKKKEFLRSLLFGHLQLLSVSLRKWWVCECLLFNLLL